MGTLSPHITTQRGSSTTTAPRTTQRGSSTTSQTAQISTYVTVTGDCDIQCDCVSSKNYPSRYGSSESCSVTMNQDASVTPGDPFSVESCCDTLMIGGIDVESAGAVPSSLSRGDTFTWTSDNSLTRVGWKLCFSASTGSS